MCDEQGPWWLPNPFTFEEIENEDGSITIKWTYDPNIAEKHLKYIKDRER